MPEKIKWKGGALLSPLPAVMVTCGTLEKPNIITIGWTGILCTNPPKTYISVRPERYSYEIIKNTGKFVINLTTAALAAPIVLPVVSGALFPEDKDAENGIVS